MALINKIRNRSTLVLIVVGLGIFLFLLGDMIGFNNVLFGQKEQIVGTINGQEIHRKTFEQEVEYLTYTYSLNNKKQPDPEAMKGIRQQAWQRLLFQYAYQPEVQEAGMKVTAEELVEMVQGQNIHPSIKQAFTNPKTGQFDRNFLIRYLNNVNRDPEQRAMWENFEKSLPDERLLSKYSGALSNAYYVTQAEARRKHFEQAATAQVDYLFVPLSSIPDSAVQVSEDELSDYFQKNKPKYISNERSAAVDMISFRITPGPEDSAMAYEDLKALTTLFKNAEDDSAFVATHSDVETALDFVTQKNLYKPLIENTERIDTGKVYGPFANQEGQYELYKVLEKKNEGKPFARASHILFQIRGKTDEQKAQAKQQAQRVLETLKNGDTTFAAMAQKYGSDATASKGGDLGYFSKGRMVPEFEQAVFGTSSEGLLPRLIETQFGYHIIKVTSMPSNTQYKIATVIREITSGESTREVVYKKAAEFAALSDSPESFAKNAEERGLDIKEVPSVKTNQDYISSRKNMSEAIRWIFSDGQVNEVSPIFENEDYYVVLLVKSKSYKGKASLAQVRDEVRKEVINEKKAQQIITKLGAPSEDLEAMKAKVGQQAQVHPQQKATMANPSMAGVGFDPAFVGRIFGQPANSLSDAFKTQNGVAVVKVGTKTYPQPIADYTRFKNSILSGVEQRAQYNVTEAIKELSNIEDNRFKYY